MPSRLLARGLLTGLLWAGGALAPAGQAGHAVAAPVVQSLSQLRYAALHGDEAKLWQFSADPAGGVPQALCIVQKGSATAGTGVEAGVQAAAASRSAKSTLTAA